VLSAALIIVALVAGVAGSWSPCGLSMVDTLAPAACGGRRRVSVIGALAFGAGALGGGAVTFGGLAVLGDELGVGGGAAAAVGIFALVVAAAGDAAGRRIVPQVRRQVPESWRRILPVPVASGLYGVLLGLGFTTFVLSFATWGLAALCLAVGEPATGLAIGLAFGLGRAIPVGVLAPLQDREGFAAVAAGMCERPEVLRGLRAAAAAGLAVAATGLAIDPPSARAAAAPKVFVTEASDPSASGSLIAWQGPAHGIMRLNGTRRVLPGTNPAVSGNLVATIYKEFAIVFDAQTVTALLSYPVGAHADALALSDLYVAWRAPGSGGRDTIYEEPLGAATGAPPTTVAIAPPGGTLGRPVLDGDQIVWEDHTATRSLIRSKNLTTGIGTVLRRAHGALLLAPSIRDGRLLYIRSTYKRQQVMLGDKVVYSTTPTARRDRGYEDGHHPHHQGYPEGKRPVTYARPPAGLTVTLWTTALDGRTAYVTRLRHLPGGKTESRILRIGV
jgi:hypothetical protein